MKGNKYNSIIRRNEILEIYIAESNIEEKSSKIVWQSN